MALLIFQPVNPNFFFSMTFIHKGINKPRRCGTSSVCVSKLSNQKLLHRRSANYQPPKWDFDELQITHKNQYQGKTYAERANHLKEQVKMMLDDGEKISLVSQLELIDNLQRLGISYHFEDKIESVLRRIYSESRCGMAKREGLYETALQFRLLRQHQFHIPQEVFDHFKCEKGNFKACLVEDTKGLLYLYEASFLSTQNEKTLDLAREFTAQNLKKYVEEKRSSLDRELIALIEHALELPLYWRMQRLEARWFMEQVYEKRPGMNPNLLEFAKLDFNIVQATHQQDLKYSSWWWKSTGFGEKFKFARDRLVENFFWTVGVTFYPEYGYSRRMSTKINAFITTIDDIYDVYGTLDELELFTDAVHRWDVKAADQLPDYMKMCYLSLFTTINEMAYDFLEVQGSYNIIPHLSKTWADLCGAYLKEAKWYSSGYTPTLQEYLNNACISISAPLILVHAYFLDSNPINKEAIDCLDTYHNIIRCSAMILRLANDLGTSSDELKRGDVPKSIQCYMKDTGASEEEARQYIKFLIREAWKEMNEEGGVKECPNFSRRFVEIAMNLGRMAQCMYQNGDGHGHQDSITTQRVLALLFQPIPLPY